MAWSPAFRLVRPDDLVGLDIKVSGTEPKKVSPPVPGGPTHTFQAGAREIWVQFGAQQIIEYAKPVGGVRANQSDPLFVPRTDLIFQVRAGEPPFPATVEGLLDVLRRSMLKTTAGDPEVGPVPARTRSGIEPHALVAAALPEERGDKRTTTERTADLVAARDAETAARRPAATRAPVVIGDAGRLAVAAAGAAGTKETLRGCLGLAFDPARSLIYIARNFRIAEPTATAVTKVARRPDGSHVIEEDITVGPVRTRRAWRSTRRRGRHTWSTGSIVP